MHLGRHPTGIPETIDSREYSPAEIWGETVEKAIREKIDLVVLTGDVLDDRSSYYESFGDFETGMKRLSSKRIPLYAISGNHDFDLLPELVGNLDGYGLRQLGTGGGWGSATLEPDGKPVLRVFGWSYPRRHVKKNPAQLLDPVPKDELPALGLLHTEPGSKNSPYAPVDLTDLEKTGINTWVLGHSHRPELRKKGNITYLRPGSLQPLDSSETGRHGPWILTLNEEGLTGTEQVPLSSLRYERVTIETDDMDDVNQIPTRFYEKIEALVEEESFSGLEIVVATIELTGRTTIFNEIKEELPRMSRGLNRNVQGTDIGIYTILNNTRPPINLSRVASGGNPAAVLAQLLIKLESGDEAEIPEELVDKTQSALTEAYFANAYSALRAEGSQDRPGREITAEVLRRQGWRILENLLSQQEDFHGQK